MLHYSAASVAVLDLREIRAHGNLRHLISMRIRVRAAWRLIVSIFQPQEHVNRTGERRSAV